MRYEIAGKSGFGSQKSQNSRFGAGSGSRLFFPQKRERSRSFSSFGSRACSKHHEISFFQYSVTHKLKKKFTAIANLRLKSTQFCAPSKILQTTQFPSVENVSKAFTKGEGYIYNRLAPRFAFPSPKA